MGRLLVEAGLIYVESIGVDIVAVVGVDALFS